MRPLDSVQSKYCLLLFIYLNVFLIVISCTPKEKSFGTKAPSHKLWTELLSNYVSETGEVNYPGIKKDSAKLHEYIQILSSHHPDPNTWTESERMAFWINAYNAFTVQLIIENYPLESIKDLNPLISIPFLNTVWDREILNIQGIEYSLNDIEHTILRKRFNEPRIHFAINCASNSCPMLSPEAYLPKLLDKQLERQTRIFLNDESKNKLSESHIRISKIFLWFNGDFTKEGSLIDFLKRYTTIEISQNAKIEYLGYDWSLNQ